MKKERISQRTSLNFIITFIFIIALVSALFLVSSADNEVNGFHSEGGKLYYLRNGNKLSGWFEEGGKRYYASLVTRVVINYDKVIGGKQYVWDEKEGLKLADGFLETEDGTLCFENGEKVFSWRHSDGSGIRIINGISEQYSAEPDHLFYFLSTTGYMVTESSYTLGGYVREFNPDHTVKPLNGYQTKNGELSYFVDGTAQIGWKENGGKRYYFLSTTQKAASMWQLIGGKLYYFYAGSSATPYALKTSGSIGGIDYSYDSSDGHVLYTGILNYEYANLVHNNTESTIKTHTSTAHYLKNGVMQYGWHICDGQLYYFYPQYSPMGRGNMAIGEAEIDGITFIFDQNGVCKGEKKTTDPEEKPDEEDGYLVHFIHDEHSSVTVFRTQADASALSDGTVSNWGYSRDSLSGEALNNGEGQLNFLISVEEGYEVDSVNVSGTYKNLKGSSDTGIDGMYRVTKIASELTVTVTVKIIGSEPTTEPEQTVDPEEKPEEEDGFLAHFITDGHARIRVYRTQLDSTQGTNGWFSNWAYSRSSSTGEALKNGEGQINFLVECESGYSISGIVIDGGYKNLKDSSDTGTENLYRITKITSDLTVSVNTEETETEPTYTDIPDDDEGFPVTFSPDEHIRIVVFRTQNDSIENIRGESITETVSRDAESGLPLSSGGQVSFRITAEEGYAVDNITVEGGYKNLKTPVDTGCLDLYRITKITSPLSVTVSAREITSPSGDEQNGQYSESFVLEGSTISASYYSGAVFEVWPTSDNGIWCPNAFFQNCIVLNESPYDFTEDLGKIGYKYRFEFYFRESDSDGSFFGPFTTGCETIYDFGNGSAIFRFLVSDAAEGDMIESWVVGREYETVIRFYSGDSCLGHSPVLQTTWTNSFNSEHLMYKAFWTRHDRSLGYGSGMQTKTAEDIRDPYGNDILPEVTDRTSAVRSSSEGSGYAETLRVKTTGEILFSPFIGEFKKYASGYPSGTAINGYCFILNIRVKDKDGNTLYEFKDLKMPIYQSKGEWFDAFLQGDGIDAGFCPEVGLYYDIYTEILDISANKVIIYGEWNDIAGSRTLSESKYYNPSDISHTDDKKTVSVRYYSNDTSKGHIEGKADQTVETGQTTEYVQAVPESGYTFLSWSDGNTNPIRCDTPSFRSSYKAIFVSQVTDAVANLYLNTETGKPITSKTDYISATMFVDSIESGFCLSGISLQIRGRGNSSWNGGASQSDYDSKNSYKLKLDSKLDLFGMGLSKNWVLGANKFDLLGLRTWSMWKLAEYMKTIPYYCEGEFVNLYVNGEYRGMYILCEQIKAESGRVEIDDGAGVADKGYLIELDFRGDGDPDETAGLTYFYIDGYSTSTEFVIKSDVESTDDTAKIKAMVQQCHNAIMTGKRDTIDQYVDIHSLIDMFIIEELSKDVDVGVASFYIQQNPGEKMYFTAPWDFDFGFGTYGPAVSSTGWYTNNGSGCTWFNTLFKTEWFRKEVENRMAEIESKFLLDYLDEIDAKAEKISVAGTLNGEYWNAFGRNYHGYVSGQASSSLRNYSDHITFFKTWFMQRWLWMKNNI